MLVTTEPGRQAEVNFVFTQLLFDLEAEVFGYFKDWAASTVLDKTFKKVYDIRRGWGHFIPGRRRYEVLLRHSSSTRGSLYFREKTLIRVFDCCHHIQFGTPVYTLR